MLMSESPDKKDEMSLRTSYMGAGIGVGVGVAIGAAMNNVAVG